MPSKFSRRQILQLIVTLIAGAATAGAVSLVSRLLGNVAQAQEAVRLEEKNIYRGREIKVRKFASYLKKEPELYINERQIDFSQEKKSRKYMTGYLPFEDFDSIEEMAKEMVDLGIQGKVRPSHSLK